MRKVNFLTFLLLAIILSACSHLPILQRDALRPSTAWVAYSSEWIEDARAVYAEAFKYIDSIEQQKEDGSWGVILDLDETVINNVEYQISRDINGAGYSKESWYAWTQKEEATLVPGAAEFIEYVNDAGGHVAFVTNRRDTEQFATESNLAKLGLNRSVDFRVFLTRAEPEATSSKDDRFALISPLLAAQGYPNVEIIAYVGDGKGDKPTISGPWRFFCIDQGGMYGEPCTNVSGSSR